MSTKRYRFAGLLLLALAASNRLLWQSHSKQYAAENSTMTLTRRQIVDQVEPLFRTLFPDQDVLHFLPTRTFVHHKGNHGDNLWLVDCLDRDAHVIAHVLWNADTRRALQLNPVYSVASRIQEPSSHRLLHEVKDEKQAIAIAREWATRLRPTSSKAVQFSGYRTKYIEHSWIVRLYLPDGMVVVWINAQSGELQNALVQDAPTSVIPTEQGQKGRRASV